MFPLSSTSWGLVIAAVKNDAAFLSQQRLSSKGYIIGWYIGHLSFNSKTASQSRLSPCATQTLEYLINGSPAFVWYVRVVLGAEVSDLGEPPYDLERRQWRSIFTLLFPEDFEETSVTSALIPWMVCAETQRLTVISTNNMAFFTTAGIF